MEYALESCSDLLSSMQHVCALEASFPSLGAVTKYGEMEVCVGMRVQLVVDLFFTALWLDAPVN